MANSQAQSQSSIHTPWSSIRVVSDPLWFRPHHHLLSLRHKLFRLVLPLLWWSHLQALLLYSPIKYQRCLICLLRRSTNITRPHSHKYRLRTITRPSRSPVLFIRIIRLPEVDLNSKQLQSSLTRISRCLSCRPFTSSIIRVRFRLLRKLKRSKRLPLLNHRPRMVRRRLRRPWWASMTATRPQSQYQASAVLQITQILHSSIKWSLTVLRPLLVILIFMLVLIRANSPVCIHPVSFRPKEIRNKAQESLGANSRPATLTSTRSSSHSSTLTVKSWILPSNSKAPLQSPIPKLRLSPLPLPHPLISSTAIKAAITRALPTLHRPCTRPRPLSPCSTLARAIKYSQINKSISSHPLQPTISCTLFPTCHSRPRNTSPCLSSKDSRLLILTRFLQTPTVLTYLTMSLSFFSLAFYFPRHSVHILFSLVIFRINLNVISFLL